jgi:hypothetical protein
VYLLAAEVDSGLAAALFADGVEGSAKTKQQHTT